MNCMLVMLKSILIFSSLEVVKAFSEASHSVVLCLEKCQSVPHFLGKVRVIGACWKFLKGTH